MDFSSRLIYQGVEVRCHYDRSRRAATVRQDAFYGRDLRVGNEIEVVSEIAGVVEFHADQPGGFVSVRIRATA